MRMATTTASRWRCPVPLAGRRDASSSPTAAAAGSWSDLLETLFLPAFDNPALDRAPRRRASLDARRRAARLHHRLLRRPAAASSPAATSARSPSTARSTTSPCAARGRLDLSAGFILEEGLADRRRCGASSPRCARAAAACGVALVTGDTKVVDRGKGDGIFVNTAGVGARARGRDVEPRRVRPGDAVIVSGDVGRHGIAVLSVREGLGFESPIESDCAPLAGLVLALLEAGIDVHCLRDLDPRRPRHRAERDRRDAGVAHRDRGSRRSP